MCAIGSIIGGLFANLPFIVAPPTAISIFLSVFLQERQMKYDMGNQAVIYSGFALIFLGWRPLGTLFTRVRIASYLRCGYIPCMCDVFLFVDMSWLVYS